MKSLSVIAAGLVLLATSGPAFAQAHKIKLGHASSAESSQQVAVVKFAVSGSTNFNGMVAQTAALELPYIFRDSKHAYAVFDGTIGQGQLDDLGKHNLKGLAYFENGRRVLTNNRRPVLRQERRRADQRHRRDEVT